MIRRRIRTPKLSAPPKPKMGEIEVQKLVPDGKGSREYGVKLPISRLMALATMKKLK